MVEPQEVITVVNGTLYRYHVDFYNVGPRSQDDMMVGYRFVQVEPDNGRLVFSSLVSRAVWSELKYGEDAEMGRKAIALGLQQAGSMKHTGSVQLRMDILSGLKSKDDISQTMVRYRILAFVYSVNSRFPKEWIARNSVKYNVSGNGKSIDDWLDSLVEAEYLRYHPAKEAEIDGDWIIHKDVFRINPTMFPKIETELEDLGFLASGDTLRAFISYSTKDAILAGQIHKVLENKGVKPFLAHENIGGSEKWMAKILGELEQCHVFVALINENYRNSKWADHEAGYADALGKRLFPLTVNGKPHGFLGRIQGIDLDPDNVALACEKIIAIIRKDEKLGPLLAKAASQSS